MQAEHAATRMWRRLTVDGATESERVFLLAANDAAARAIAMENQAIMHVSFVVCINPIQAPVRIAHITEGDRMYRHAQHIEANVNTTRSVSWM